MAAQRVVMVVDMQNGVFATPRLARERCVAQINRLVRAADKVIFIQHESASGYLEYASVDWQLADGLIVKDTDLKVRKTTPDSSLRTDLEALLKARGVEQLVICGMHTEFCVDTTTRRALALGYPVVLVSDGHTSAGNEAISAPQVIAHHNAALSNISSFGSRVVPTLAQDIQF